MPCGDTYVAEIGYPTHCPHGHLQAPEQCRISAYRCLEENTTHRAQLWGCCDAMWVDRACTEQPGWHTAEQLHRLEMRDGGDGYRAAPTAWDQVSRQINDASC